MLSFNKKTDTPWNIEIARFDQIKPVWEAKLWPARQTPVEAVSILQYLGGKDTSIYKSKPVFWVVSNDSEVIGVNSGFKTTRHYFRSRGLWVAPQYRNQGIGSLLLDLAIERARKQRCHLIWSFPRKESLFVYEKCGFTQVSDWFSHDVEFGPNCFVSRKL